VKRNPLDDLQTIGPGNGRPLRTLIIGVASCATGSLSAATRRTISRKQIVPAWYYTLTPQRLQTGRHGPRQMRESRVVNDSAIAGRRPECGARALGRLDAA